jgi:hypothetical protein
VEKALFGLGSSLFPLSINLFQDGSSLFHPSINRLQPRNSLFRRPKGSFRSGNASKLSFARLNRQRRWSSAAGAGAAQAFESGLSDGDGDGVLVDMRAWGAGTPARSPDFLHLDAL